MKKLVLILAAALISIESHAVKPVKVFILAGQSNMEGHGQIRSLPHLGNHPKYGYLLKKLQNADRSWIKRDDVTISWRHKTQKHGPLSVGWGYHDHEIGPELMFGAIMGEKHDAHVLLIKTAWGGKDVYCDFRSPSAGEPCEQAMSIINGEWNNRRKIGLYYDQMIANIKNCLENIALIVPDYEDQGYELAGVAWFQGWNDFCHWSGAPQLIENYPDNLASMITDLRKDLNAPDLPFAIGEMGIGGIKMAERAEKNPNDHEAKHIMKFRNAQKAVAEKKDLKNVFFVPTAEYWDDRLQELREMSNKHWNKKKKKGIKSTEQNHLPTKELNDEFLALGHHWYCHYNGSSANYSLIGYALAETLNKQTDNKVK